MAGRIHVLHGSVLGIAAGIVSCSCAPSRDTKTASKSVADRSESSTGADPPKPAAPAQPRPAVESPPASPCRGANLRFEQIWTEACQLGKPPPPDDEPPLVELVIDSDAEYISGERASIGIALANRTEKEVELVFAHWCANFEPGYLFDLEVMDSRGVRAMLTGRPRLGILLSTPCEFPYIRATLPPNGTVSTETDFIVAAEQQVTEPALPPGPLPPGTYTVEVTAPLMRHPTLKERFSLVVRGP